MSAPAEGAAASVPLAVRVVLGFALLGLLAGFLWGVSDVPRYTATAGVVVSPDDGEEVDRAELVRVAARAESAEVADAASRLLGGDLAGADLLADVAVVPAPRSGGVVVRATADAPDIAAGAADGYAAAIVEEGGDGLESGAAARIPSEPSENRSAARSSAIGLLAGLIVGALAAAVLRRRRAAPRPERAVEPASRPATAPDGDLAESFGAPVLAARVDPARLLTRSPGGRLGLDPEGAAAIELLADELELESEGAPRLLMVVSPGRGEGSGEVTAALAVTAAGLGLTVIAVDADTESPSLAEVTGVSGAPGLADHLEGDAGPRNVLRAVPLGRGRSIVVLPAGEPHDRGAAEIDEDRLTALLRRLPRVYDLVLLAGPPAAAAGPLAARTDGAVLVASGADGSAAAIAAAARDLGAGTVLAGVIASPGAAQARPQAALPSS